MNKTLKYNKAIKWGLWIFGLVLLAISMSILASMDWKIALGVFIFGWSLNVDNRVAKM
jgi:hypothetical protein